MKTKINIEDLKRIILELQFPSTDVYDGNCNIGDKPDYLIRVEEFIEEICNLGFEIEQMNIKNTIPIDCMQCGTAFINKKDLTKKELKHINDFEVLILFQDLGNRGNFSLIPKVAGFETIQFKDSKRVKK